MRRMRRLAAIFAILLVSVFVLSACKGCARDPDDTATYEYTPLGLIRKTDVVKDPSNDVTISVFSRGRTEASGKNELTYDKALIANTADSAFTRDNVRNVQSGDIVHISADYQYIKLEMLDMGESILYSPTGEYVFQVPATGTPNWQRPYPDVFGRTSTTIKASIPTVAEIMSFRNLALNPYDILYQTELNVTTATDLVPDGSELVPADSIAVENREILAYPHAYANRFTTGNDRGSFLARNAIDGVGYNLINGNKSHINYGQHSWGGGRAPTTNNSPAGPAWTAANNYGYYDDLSFTLYFGREVELSELGFVIRADDSGTVAHDIHFSGMTAEFSNGTEQTIGGLEFTASEQKKVITPVKTTYVRLKDFTRAWDTSLTATQAQTLGNWTALSEFSAYGKEELETIPGKKKKDPAIPVIPAAIKTYTSNTFGGKEIKNTTNAFKASDMKEIVDFAAKDAVQVQWTRRAATEWKTEIHPEGDPSWSAGPRQPVNYWQDSVLYSALSDAYTTTGTMDHYTHLQYVSDMNKYTIRNNESNRGARTGQISNTQLKGDPIVGNVTGTSANWVGSYTDFADDYLMGETYLFMNDMNPADHKAFNAFVNADALMLPKASWDPQLNHGTGFSPNTENGEHSRNNPDGILDWWWCDSIYMGLNYFTFMTNTTGDGSYLKKAFDSYQFWKDILACTGGCDGYAGPYAGIAHGKAGHGGDWALWHRDTDNQNIGLNSHMPKYPGSELPSFWARGNAWVYAALAKQMQYIDPDKYPIIYNSYKDDFIAMSKTLKHYVRDAGADGKQGGWNVSIIDPTYFPGREASGTSGFLFGMAIGVQLGILDYNEYMPVVINAFNALEGMKLYDVTDSRQNLLFVAGGAYEGGIPNGRLGYMQGVGYRTYDYEEEDYVRLRSSPFSYGLYIHAVSALMRMCEDYTPAEFNVPADSQAGVLRAPKYEVGKGMKV